MKTCPKKFYFISFGFLALLGLIMGVGYSNNIKDNSSGQSEMPRRDINEVMEAHVEELMKLPGVVGVYISALDDGTPCIKVMVVEKTTELEQKIPKFLEGHPVLLIATGEIRPLSKKPN